MTSGDNGLPRGTEINEFVVEQVLGVGGFGVTYLAADRKLDRWVAIKEYLPRDWGTRQVDGTVGPRSSSDAEDYRWGLARFLEEARTLARLDDARILRVYQVLEGRGTAYMVTEYVEGRNLEETLTAEGPWPEARVRALLEDLLPGLAAVHQADLVHRDIKPANVMVRADGRPVLIDFGAARYAAGVHSHSLASVLTPGYAPHEQYRTDGKQGPWTDVYALGAVAYRALSGRSPVEATARVRADPLASLAEVAPGRVSEAFGKAVAAALAVWPEDRPQDVAAWRAQWDQQEAVPRRSSLSTPSPAKDSTKFEDFSSGSDRRDSGAGFAFGKWSYGVAASVFAAGVAVGIFILNRDGNGPNGANDTAATPVATSSPATTTSGTVSGADTSPDAVVPMSPSPMSLPEETESALRLDRTTWQLVQAGLARAGFNPGPADGFPGERTREALRRWQESRGDDTTGRLNAESMQVLRDAGFPLPNPPTNGTDDENPVASDDTAVTAGGTGPEPETVPECSRQVRLEGGMYFNEDMLDETCSSFHYSDGKYAMHYEFTLDQAAMVAVEMMSYDYDVDPWLALRSGGAPGSAVALEEDDDDGDGLNARIQTFLGPGDYTVEATTARGGQTGTFALALTVDGGPLPAECSRQVRLEGGRTYYNYEQDDTLDGTCSSVYYSDGEYAMHYEFTLDQAAMVAVEMMSTDVDPWLALRSGGAPGSAVALEEDDDGGEGLDARIRRFLNAGSYTVEATTVGGGRTGDFTLTLAVDYDVAECSRQVRLEGGRTHQRNDTLDGTCPVVRYGFSLDQAALVFAEMKSTDVDSWLALRGDNTVTLEENDDGFFSLDARIQRFLYAGSYTIEATTANEGEMGDFTLTLAVGYERTLAVDSAFSAAIDSVGDKDIYRAVVSSPQILSIYTTGDTDTVGTLLDASGSVLDLDDDGGEGNNFLLSQSVAPGTYYVLVEHLGDFGTGPYVIIARATGM